MFYPVYRWDFRTCGLSPNQSSLRSDLEGLRATSSQVREEILVWVRPLPFKVSHRDGGAHLSVTVAKFPLLNGVASQIQSSAAMASSQKRGFTCFAEESC